MKQYYKAQGMIIPFHKVLAVETPFIYVAKDAYFRVYDTEEFIEAYIEWLDSTNLKEQTL